MKAKKRRSDQVRTIRPDAKRQTPDEQIEGGEFGEGLRLLSFELKMVVVKWDGHDLAQQDGADS